MKSTIIIFMLLFSGILYSQVGISGGIFDEKINSNFEDYGAYLKLGTEYDTLFFTSSRPVEKKNKTAIRAEMFYSTRASKERYIKPINEGWAKAKQIEADDSRIAGFIRGTITFNTDETKIIFAAERDLSNSNAKGTSYLFDLYEMYASPTGFTNPIPLVEVNEPDYWDSQPSMSPDGKLLFFVSNRPGGSGGLDIWYSYLNYLSQWSKPQPVPYINTPGNEYSPHYGYDGYFYFSSDWDFENNKLGNRGKDIYRAEFYSNQIGLLLPKNPIELDKAVRLDAQNYGIKIPEGLYYNSDKNDEFPYISKDRKFIFITSDRDANYEKRNIYAFALPKSRIRLQVNVYEKLLGPNGNVLIDFTRKNDLSLTLIDNETNKSKEIMSGQPYEVDADKTYKINVSKFVEEECYTNKIEGPKNLEITTTRPFGKDTLFVRDIYITRQKIQIPPIIFVASDTLPYFITGYWYPITQENMKIYRQREANGFFDKTGFVDSTGYDYDLVSQKIEKNFQDKIYYPLEEILPAFQDFCRDTLFLKVTIHGYTDPRGLSAGEDHPYRSQSKGFRNYPDETVTVGLDERGQEVTITSGMNMLNYNWPINPNDKNGKWIKLPNEGEMGNVLLSKLRAYFTFVTFDKEMMKRSKIYEQLRQNGKVIFDAEGFGIDKEGFKERGLRDDPKSRRIEIYIDILRPEELQTHKRLAGGELLYAESNTQNRKGEQIKNENDLEKPQTQPFEQKIETEQKDVTLPIDPNIKKELENMEKEEEYSDKEEIQEKYADIKPQNIKNKQVETNYEITKYEAEQQRSCYKIYYKDYKDSSEALQAKRALEAAGVEEVKVVEVFDNFGNNRTYELYSGCYSKVDEAMNALKRLSFTINLLKLDKKPLIIR